MMFVNQSVNNDMQQQSEQDVLLPGFRFHPTDEELVRYYLRRKVMHRPLQVEVITQLDIYKFDPWELPHMAVGKGEKEWYFFCPRDRKYRNSARPNRVTGSGFWKATGTDRPIYSGDGANCIGLKKSLVFYRGRAAKGIKTDWMMHEFRLPPSTDASSTLNKLHSEDSSLQQDAWAVCRIFKKSTLAQRHAPASEHWAIAQHDKMVPDSLAKRFPVQSDCSSPGDLELDASSPDRSENTSDDFEFDQVDGGSILQTPQQQMHYPQQKSACYETHGQQPKQDQQSTPSWQSISNHSIGGLVVDSAAASSSHVLRRQKSNIVNETVYPQAASEMVNPFFVQESASVRGALDFVNCMLNSPQSGSQFMSSNASCHDSSMDQLRYRGQDVENVCPTFNEPKMSTPPLVLETRLRREMSLQIPQAPLPQQFCGIQPWDNLLSPTIFDISTSQLECM